MDRKYKALGMMSGTSLDGLDMAFCVFGEEEGKWSFELIAAKTIEYTEEWKEKLDQAIHLDALQLALLDQAYGTWLGEQVAGFIRRYQVQPELIASHGHTVFHQPEQGLTLQIGSGQHLAMQVDIPVICDFRTMDVALGGQGAPLVPIGDRLLFGDFDFCLNLGGISNISFDLDGERVAYDIGAANMLLNYLSNQVGKNYDANGAMAATGSLDQLLFDQLNALDYFQADFPKSLGREWFDDACLPILKATKSNIPDQLHTACKHIAFQIAENIKKILPGQQTQKLLVTGGGAKNDFLIECLEYALPERVTLHIPEEKLIDYKEAIVFALLGVLRSRGEINTLHSVTGASRSESCGRLFRQKYTGVAVF